MNTDEAIEKLERMQAQIVHGSNIFGDIAAVIRGLVAISESRRVTLEAKAEELRQEWIRAENAEGERDRLRKALVGVAEYAPDYEYPKEWNTDPTFVRHVPYCRLIAAKAALDQASASVPHHLLGAAGEASVKMEHKPAGVREDTQDIHHIPIDVIAEDYAGFCRKVYCDKLPLPCWIKIGREAYKLTAENRETIMVGLMLANQAREHFKQTIPHRES